jgi:hypothetical protein
MSRAAANDNLGRAITEHIDETCIFLERWKQTDASEPRLKL